MRVLTCLAALTLATMPATAPAVEAAGNTSQKTANATFTQPAGWSLKGDPAAMTIVAPEGDLELSFVDVPGAANAAAAVATAWQRQYPGFNRKLEITAPAAAKDGWEEQVNFSYQTSPAEHQVATAYAYRRGSNWTVMLGKGNAATFEKRLGTAVLALGSLRPAGYTVESFAGRTPHRLDAARIAALKQFVTASMQELEVAGVSVALIDHGKLVFSGGFGVKQVGKPDKVDGDTLFMVASNTKGMSTLMLAKLVDEGRFKWTDKVTAIYPSFRLGSDATTASVEMRHLVCACTGLPRRDYPDILAGSSITTPASTTFRNLAATEPTSKFGEAFQYNNLMAAAAGYVGGQVLYPGVELGAAYDRAMAEKVWGPLGMTATTLDAAKARRGNHATGHGADIDGRLAVAEERINTAFYFERPAGAAWSSANDMIKYVENEITEGVLPNGKRYIGAANLVERRKPNVPLGEHGFYGMGLMGDKTADVPWYHHGGDLIGFHSDLYFIPDAKVGAVLLTNTDSGAAMRAPFIRRLLELLYDGKPEAAASIKAASGSIKAGRIAERKTLTFPADPATAAGLASRYVSSDLGTLAFTRKNGQLFAGNGVWDLPMATRVNADGSKSVVTAATGLTGIEFVIADAGGKRGLVIRDGQHEYRYTEAP